MTILLQEYRNQHAHRRYPFADDATMTSTIGTVLPPDVFVDAFLYPIDLTGMVYISEFNFSARRIVFKDAGNDAVCGTATWQDGADVAVVVDVSGFEREIGQLVLGPGFAGLKTAEPLVFGPQALPLAPTCFVPLNQAGVRGIVTDDARLSTGHIKFEGRNGVVITTYIKDGKSIIRIDLVGMLPPGGPECNDCPPIERLVIENVDCPPVVGSHGGDGVLFVVGGFDLSVLCPPKALPGAYADACDPPPPPPAWPCPPNSYDVVPAVNGRIEIAAPSTLGLTNPVRIAAEPGKGEAFNLNDLNTLSNISDIERRLRQLMKAGIKPGGSITISLKAKK